MQAEGAWRQVQLGWKYDLENGSSHLGWLRDSAGDWYYLDPVSGIMKTGWQQMSDGRWYFFNPVSDGTKGRMLTGWQWIDGYCYYFDQSKGTDAGHMLAGSRTPDGFLVNAQGQWTDENGSVQYVSGKGFQTKYTASIGRVSGGGSAGGSSSGGGNGGSGAKPEKPGGTDQPETPEQPAEPGEPEQPATPSEPEQPATPSEPEKPATPSEPEKPATPSKPEKPGRTVRSWEKFEKLEVAYQTPEEDVRALLPAHVTLNLSDGEVIEADLFWDTVGIDTSRAGATYKLYPDYELPPDVGGKKPAVYVRVKIGKAPEESLTATELTGLSPVSIRYGAKISEVQEALPQTAQLRLSNGETAEISLDWSALTGNDVNTWKAGTYTVTAAYELPEGVSGAKPEASVEVTVLPKEEQAPALSAAADKTAYLFTEHPILQLSGYDEKLPLSLTYYRGDWDLDGKELTEGTDYLLDPAAGTVTLLSESFLTDNGSNKTVSIDLHQGEQFFSISLQYLTEGEAPNPPEQPDTPALEIKLDKEQYYAQENPVLTISGLNDASSLRILKKDAWGGEEELTAGTHYLVSIENDTVQLYSEQLLDGLYDGVLSTPEELELSISMGEQSADLRISYQANLRWSVYSDEADLRNLPRNEEVRVELDTWSLDQKDETLKKQIRFYAKEAQIAHTRIEADGYSTYLYIPYASIEPYLDESGAVVLTGKLAGAKDVSFNLSFQTEIVNAFELTPDKAAYYYQENPILTIGSFDPDAVISVTKIAEDSYASDKVLTKGSDYQLNTERGELELYTHSIFQKFSESFSTDTTVEFRVKMDDKLSAIRIPYLKSKQLSFSAWDTGNQTSDLVRGRDGRIRIMIDDADRTALQLYAGETELTGYTFAEETGDWGSVSDYLVIPFAMVENYLDAETGSVQLTARLQGAKDQSFTLSWRSGEAAKLGLHADKTSFYYTERPLIEIRNYDGTAGIDASLKKGGGSIMKLTEGTDYSFDAVQGALRLYPEHLFDETEQGTAQEAELLVIVGGQKLDGLKLSFQLPAAGKAISAVIYLEDPADISTAPAGYPVVSYSPYSNIKVDFAKDAFSLAFLEENLTVELQNEAGDRFTAAPPASYADSSWYLSQEAASIRLLIPTVQEDADGNERIQFKKKEDGSYPVTDIYLNLPGYGEQKLSVVIMPS